jgi:hypothetical protein
MDAIEFIRNYNKFLEEIEKVINPELFPVLEKFKQTDPHDLINPKAWFISTSHARGFVWTLFISKCNQD